MSPKPPSLLPTTMSVSGVTRSAIDIKPRKPGETRMMPVSGSTVCTQPWASPCAASTSHAPRPRAERPGANAVSSCPGISGAASQPAATTMTAPTRAVRAPISRLRRARWRARTLASRWKSTLTRRCLRGAAAASPHPSLVGGVGALVAFIRHLERVPALRSRARSDGAQPLIVRVERPADVFDEPQATLDQAVDLGTDDALLVLGGADEGFRACRGPRHQLSGLHLHARPQRLGVPEHRHVALPGGVDDRLRLGLGVVQQRLDFPQRR